MKCAGGSITVVLSLVLLVLLSLAAAFVEGARIHTGKQKGWLVANAAADAGFTNYYLPLYEKYHLFFLNYGIDTKNLEGQEFIESLCIYLSEGLSSEQEEYGISGSDLYRLQVDEIKLNGVTTAVEYNGEIFLNEVLSYMKYDIAAGGVEKILEMTGAWEEAAETTAVIGKKFDVESSMGQLDEMILALMQKLDGVLLCEDGTIKAAETYGKMFACHGISQELVALHHKELYAKMETHYIDVMAEFEAIESKSRRLLECIREEKRLKETSEDEKATKKQKKELKKEKKKLLKEIKEKRKVLSGPVDEMMLLLDESWAIIGELSGKQEEINGKLKEYEEILEAKKDSIPEDTYKELQADYEEKEEYVSEGGKESSYISEIEKMKPVVEADYKLLENLKWYEEVSLEAEETTVENFLQKTGEYKELMTSYEIVPLSFDYSQVTIPEPVDSPLESFENLLEEGILSLVLEDASALSEGELKEADRLWNLYGETEESGSMEDSSENFSETMKNAGEEDQQVSGSLEDFSESGKVYNAEAGVFDTLLQNVLLERYLSLHFPKWGDDAEGIEYAMEYVLCGEKADRENLKGMINRLMFSRTIMNFISILTDSEKKNQAYTTAAALVGFAGLEPLTRFTQTLILLAWAYEEALVDVAALLEGKEIPVMKTGTQFSITYKDLLCISRPLIVEKVGKLPESSAGLTMSYEDYLMIFLFLVPKERRCYRAMDLIEHDMKAWEESFSMEQCIFGMELSVKLSMKAKPLFPVPGAQKDEYHFSYVIHNSY